MNSFRPVASARNVFVLLLVLFGCTFGTPAFAGKVRAYTGKLDIPTYGWAAVRHPYLRNTDNVNIYPYPMLDFLSREKTNRTYRTVILENDYLRITFLPELGGKIHEVINKSTGKPVFYVNHVIKPGLIGQCGAWTSGGVEWNTGPQGHTVSCMLPVDVQIQPTAADGSVSVAVGETERIYGTKWTVLVTLRPDRAFIEEHIRIYNPTETIRPYYFWNCTAAPNTPGFRFIYPMTLGCDHAGEKFFRWPVDNGKDLTRGKNYIDASSIFAWHCDQDFFGSYNDDLKCGVVAVANHHQVPGKKAWTWGQGGFGRMHQMDLTDTDGPYNEVQTGPLLTQAQVGRLDPSEAVEWTEWWYPIHELGGFTFANKEVAVNAITNQDTLNLRMIGTASSMPVEVRVTDSSGTVVGTGHRILSPKTPAEVQLPFHAGQKLSVTIQKGSTVLADFDLPLRLPDRQPPGPKAKIETATQFAEAGWEDLLFARYSEADSKFRSALGKDAHSVQALDGLAFLNLFAAPEVAQENARAALQSQPGDGLAHLAIAAACQMDDPSIAQDHAWKASLEPVSAVAGRALAARILLRAERWNDAIAALSESGPWESDPVCRDLYAFADFQLGHTQAAVQIARQSLEIDPLDHFALALLWLQGNKASSRKLAEAISGKAIPVLDLAARFEDINQPRIALRLIRAWYLDKVPVEKRSTLVRYWAEHLTRVAGQPDAIASDSWPVSGSPVSEVDPLAIAENLPYRHADVLVLKDAVAHRPGDAEAAFGLGNVLAAFGRINEARNMWESAVKQRPDNICALRALGMDAKNSGHDLLAARSWLEQASKADPADAIVARDLARTLFELADKAGSDSEKQSLAEAARDRLQRALPAGKGRSDFVALLARAQNRLGDYAATASMLDHVRVTVWEGAHEVHDLFEQAHLAMGEASLNKGNASAALAEFNRALEYPENLATGKLENAREAHIQYLRGKALAELGRKDEAAAAWRLASGEGESSDSRQKEAQRKAREALEALLR